MENFAKRLFSHAVSELCKTLFTTASLPSYTSRLPVCSNLAMVLSSSLSQAGDAIKHALYAWCQLLIFFTIAVIVNSSYASEVEL